MLSVPEHCDFFYDFERKTSSTEMETAHFHNKHELYFLKKGTTKYFINNQILLLQEGDMVFIPKGVFHRTDNLESNYVERHVIYFKDEYLSPKYEPLITDLSNYNYIRFSTENIIQIEDIINKISYEFNNQLKHFDEMQRMYLQQLLFLISRLRLKDTKPDTAELYITIQKIVTYISEHVNQDLTLTTLSQKFEISPTYLSKQFKILTGIGLNEYINIARVSKAERYLKENKYSIVDIAKMCGYQDSNYFSSVFKKLKGITPKKYSTSKGAT